MKNNLTQPTNNLRFEVAQITIWGLFAGLVSILVMVASL